MKKPRKSSSRRMAEENIAAGFTDLVEGTLTGERLAAVMIEKGAAVRSPPAASLAGQVKMPDDAALDRQLDLHGMTVDEALRRVGYFLQNRRHQGLRQVRIITGKGLHSAGGAVLPEAVEQTLIGLKRQGEIHSFQWEKDDRARSGALIVHLFAP